jgi:ankyrin repeat protein
MTLYDNMAYVGYVTIPEDAHIVVMENKIKINKVILNGPLIPLVDFIDIAVIYGSDIHLYNDFALRWASKNGHLDIVECLIKHGANIHADNKCALIVASMRGYLNIVECLIKHGAADIHHHNDRALKWASKHGHLAVVKCLIKHCESLYN